MRCIIPKIKRLSNDKAKSEDAIKDALEWYEKNIKLKLNITVILKSLNL